MSPKDPKKENIRLSAQQFGMKNNSSKGMRWDMKEDNLTWKLDKYIKL